MNDSLTYMHQAANRGDQEWSSTFAAMAQAEALDRIEHHLESIACSLETLAKCVAVPTGAYAGNLSSFIVEKGGL